MKYSHKRIFLTWNPGRLFVAWMRKIRFKKYENVSLYKIFKTFLRNLEKDEILDRANGVAFNFILAIFPGIIFLFTLIPYISRYFPEINKESIMGFLSEMIPQTMADIVSTTVLDIVSNQRGGLLTFGFLFALYLATNGMMSLMRAFNACYKTNENRGAIKMRLIATALTFNLAIVLILSVVLLIVGELILGYIGGHLPDVRGVDPDGITVTIVFALRFLVIFVMFFISIATIYYFGPAIHYNWKFFSIGSLIATLSCLTVSYGFSFYVTNFGTYNKVYGSIGVLIAMMVWVQLLTIVLLVGYEINASIHDAIRMEVLWKSRRNRKS